jgi:hypothetical protein
MGLGVGRCLNVFEGVARVKKRRQRSDGTRAVMRKSGATDHFLLRPCRSCSGRDSVDGYDRFFGDGWTLLERQSCLHVRRVLASRVRPVREE